MRLEQILPWISKPAEPPSAFDRFTIDPDYVTAPMPKILWIELTSKCPFDCIFCTRKSRFGAGRNLDFEIYQRVIAELESPEVGICLTQVAPICSVRGWQKNIPGI